MIGYKGTGKNGKCLNLKYEVGKTYEITDGELKMCSVGFHFYQEINNIGSHYGLFDKDSEYYEVEALGKIITKGDKSVTDKIKIIRKLTYKDIEELTEGKIKCDDRGNYIYEKHSDGYWVKYKYDESGNLIYQEHSGGSCWKFEYDSNGNKIYEEDSYGEWAKYKYDDSGNMIKEEDSNGYWHKYEYDDNNNKIKEENEDGLCYKWKYDKNNNMIEKKDSYGFFVKYEYNKNNNLIKRQKNHDIHKSNHEIKIT